MAKEERTRDESTRDACDKERKGGWNITSIFSSGWSEQRSTCTNHSSSC